MHGMNSEQRDAIVRVMHASELRLMVFLPRTLEQFQLTFRTALVGSRNIQLHQTTRPSRGVMAKATREPA